MSIPDEKIQEFRAALQASARPLFFFDGDADGLTSYVQLYRFKGEGKGIMVSGRPQLTAEFARKYEEYQPDAIFILDLAQLSQEFIDHIQAPMYWLDHHDPAHPELHLPKRMHYYNPRLWDDSDGRPTSFWAYRIAQKDIWIALAGVVSDYHFDAEMAATFRQTYPHLLPAHIKDQGQALFDSPLGTLVRVLNFNLKGPVSTAMTSVKILTRIEHPDEILQEESPRGRYLFRRYQRVLGAYEKLYKAAESAVAADEFLVFLYNHDLYSLSGELANELKYRHQDKIVIIGRKHDGKVMMSLRSEREEIVGALKEALEGLDGYGGGHPKACGAVVSQAHFDEFLAKFKKAFLEQRKAQGI
jgi:hypothetical protein